VVINSSKIKFFSILCSHNRQKAFTLKLVQLEKMNYKLSNVSVNPKRGFTLIEVMLVMAIFSLLMGFVTINLLRPQNKASVDSLSTQLIADIKQQQLKAMVGDSEGQATSQQFGVYFESDGYTLFRGSSYSASEASNFEVTLEDVTADTIPVGGTSISNAVETAIKSYEGGEKKNKILIIITDGEDLEGGVERAVVKAKGEGVKIFCVGIGTETGELIPVRDERGKVTFLKDDEGNVVKTRLDEGLLQSAALETGGMYVRSTGAQFGLDIIYDQKLAKLEKEAFKSKLEKRYKEKYQIPLGLAFILLLLELFVGEKKEKVKSKK